MDKITYQQTFTGLFNSLLQWEDLTQFWEKLQQGERSGWFIYAVGEVPPTTQASVEEFEQFILRIDTLLRKEHDERICGIVYPNHPQTPSMVKIYDPNNLGISCGSSENPPLPGWVLSRQPPIDLQPTDILPGNRKRWWRSIFS